VLAAPIGGRRLRFERRRKRTVLSVENIAVWLVDVAEVYLYCEVVDKDVVEPVVEEQPGEQRQDWAQHQDLNDWWIDPSNSLLRLVGPSSSESVARSLHLRLVWWQTCCYWRRKNLPLTTGRERRQGSH
jgi:hypothetical protein